MTSTRPVVVIGAGVAGLAAASVLHAHGLPVVVLDRAQVPGGRVRTLALDGLDVDVGAQFLATFYPRTLRAVRALGLSDDLCLRRQRGAVLHDGRAWPISEPARLLLPGLLPASGAARLAALALPVLAHRRHLDPDDLREIGRYDDRTAGDLVRRWAGPAVAERLVDPLLGGVMYWDLDRTSQALLLLMLRVSLHARRVYGLRGGLDRIPRGLAARLDVRTATEVRALRPLPHGGWSVDVGEGIAAQGVVLATTAPVAARLLEVASPPTAAHLRQVSYAATAVVTCRVPDGAEPVDPLLFDRRRDPLLAAVTVVGRGSDGPVVRIFLSDRGARELGTSDDDRLAEAALDAVGRSGPAGGWAARATRLDVTRWDEALPRFEVGRLRSALVQSTGALEPSDLVLAGDYIGGPFLEGALGSGVEAARRLLLTQGTS